MDVCKCHTELMFDQSILNYIYRYWRCKDLSQRNLSLNKILLNGRQRYVVSINKNVDIEVNCKGIIQDSVSGPYVFSVFINELDITQ